MTQIEILKPHKKMGVGEKPNVDDAYAAILIKTGKAKKIEAKADKK